jgi:hypothetical protein
MEVGCLDMLVHGACVFLVGDCKSALEVASELVRGSSDPHNDEGRCPYSPRLPPLHQGRTSEHGYIPRFRIAHPRALPPPTPYRGLGHACRVTLSVRRPNTIGHVACRPQSC